MSAPKQVPGKVEFAGDLQSGDTIWAMGEKHLATNVDHVGDRVVFTTAGGRRISVHSRVKYRIARKGEAS